MVKELEDRIVSDLRKHWVGDGFNEDVVRLTIRYLESHRLTRRGEPVLSEVSPMDKDRLENIRERDIQRRIAEEGGIIGGMRESFEIAFLLDYIDKLEGRK